MTINVKKIGGSVAVLIPKSIARDLDLVEGTPLEVTADNGSLHLTRKLRSTRRARRSMAEIVAQIDPASYKARAQEFADTVGDPPVGKEFW